MTVASPFLLLGSFLALIGFGVSGLLLSQAHATQQKRAQRLDTVAAPYRTIRTMAPQAFRAALDSDRSLIDMAASLFGFVPARSSQYPLQWWVVLPVAFVLARIAAGFIVDVVGAIGLFAMPLVWVLLSRSFFGWAVERRKARLLRQFPDALAMVVRSVRVGIPVLGAITSVAGEAPVPTSIEFTRLANDLAVGVPLDEATGNMAERNDLAEYRFFATAVGLQAQTGGGLSATLENLAELIRKRLALRERGHALSSEARSSALILGGLPVVMGFGLWLINPGYIGLLFKTGLGHKLLGIAVVSLACGGLTMRSIIKRTLS